MEPDPDPERTLSLGHQDVAPNVAGVFPKLHVWKISDILTAQPGAAQQTGDSDPVTPKAVNLAFSPDGQRIAVSDLNVQIMDVTQWRSIGKLPHSNRVEPISWSPDGL